jgi:hypothetical protein
MKEPIARPAWPAPITTISKLEPGRSVDDSLMGLVRSRTALSETSGRAPSKVETVRGRRSLPESHVVVELNTGNEGDCDDRRDCPIDNEAERRPPASVGDELVAVLPQILEPVARKPSDQQPRRHSHADGGDHNDADATALSATTTRGRPSATAKPIYTEAMTPRPNA